MREYLYLLFLAISALTGSIGGFMSARLYRSFNRSAWKIHTTLTVLLVPVFAITILAAMTYAESIEITRFGEYKTSEFDKVFFLWALFDMPNVAIGCWLGYRSNKINLPVKPTRFIRNVPPLCQTPIYA